jgi:hypothetical protein
MDNTNEIIEAVENEDIETSAIEGKILNRDSVLGLIQPRKDYLKLVLLIFGL